MILKRSIVIKPPLLQVRNRWMMIFLVSCTTVILLLSFRFLRRKTIERVHEDDDNIRQSSHHIFNCKDKVVAALAKAKKLNQKYRAFIQLTPDLFAIKQAERLDAIPIHARKPLHCITIAVKDNIETDSTRWGLQTFAGSAALKTLLVDNGPSSSKSAEALQSLENEGVVVLGKANMDDFALQYHSYSTEAGQTLNCHDPHRYPGGSSGGSAVAVSLGMVDLALGTDTGGSIRIPASFAGIVGLRPSLGTISTKGVIPLSTSRDTLGPMGRNVLTVKNAFEVLKGKSCLGSSNKSFRVGVLRDLFTDDTWMQMQSAIQVVRNELGGVEVTNNLPESITRARLVKQTKSASMYEFEQDLGSYLTTRYLRDSISLSQLVLTTKDICASNPAFACDQIVDSLEKKLKTSGTIPPSLLKSWQETRNELIGFLNDNKFDAIVFPAFTALPTRISTGKKQEFCPNNRLAAISGAASLVVFAGFRSSLPQGLEILGLDECKLLEIGSVFERKFNQFGACAKS
jgi:amidase